MRMRNGTWKASWSTPPINTAHASAITGGSIRGASQIEQPMKERFSNAGVNAGTENLPNVLSTPPASDTSEMNRM